MSAPTYTVEELCTEIEKLIEFGQNCDSETTVGENPLFLKAVRKFEAKVNACPELDDNPLGPGIRLMVKALLTDIEFRKIGS